MPYRYYFIVACDYIRGNKQKDALKKVLFSALFLGLLFFIFTSNVAAVPPTYDLTDTPNPKQYNIKISGQYYNLAYPVLADFNDNGKADIVNYTFTSSSTRGALIIYDNILDTDGIGRSLSGVTDYTLYIKSTNGTTYGGLGASQAVADITNDGKVDLIIGAGRADPGGKSDAGSVYIIPNIVFSGVTSKTDIDITSSNLWTMRIDGALAGHEFGTFVNTGDYNNDGLVDLIVCSPRADYNSRINSGSCYILENRLISNSSTFNTDTLDLSDSNNYTLRVDGVTSTSNAYGTDGAFLKDIDNDGIDDMIVSNNWVAYPGRTMPGSAWILRNSLLTSANADKSIDLATASNYNIRYLGEDDSALNIIYDGQIIDIDRDGKQDLFLDRYYISGDILENLLTNTGQDIDLRIATNYTATITGGEDTYFASPADYNNDGVTDIFYSNIGADYSGVNYGSMYILNGNMFSTLTGTGSELEVTSTDNYLARYDGGATYTVKRGGPSGDINGDGMYDFVFATDNQSKLWVIFNFPHTISGNSLSVEDANNSSVTITGLVTAPNSVSTIAGVQYSIDDNSPTAATWKSCIASDGNFNSTSENYSCVINQSLENHNIFIRAVDVNGVYTARTNYHTQSFKQTSSSGLVQIPQITTPGIVGKYQASETSSTGGQEVVAVVSSQTLGFDSFLSANLTQPNAVGSLPNPITGTANTIVPTLVVTGAFNTLGIVINGSTFWQLGNIQNIWYKAYGPGNNAVTAAKIIPELQKNVSTITLSYKNQKLVYTGNETDFEAAKLKLAYSADGVKWKILSNSVVDTQNQTVSAVGKIGGYYLIVAPVLGVSTSQNEAHQDSQVQDHEPVGLSQPALINTENTKQPPVFTLKSFVALPGLVLQNAVSKIINFLVP